MPGIDAGDVTLHCFVHPSIVDDSPLGAAGRNGRGDGIILA